MSVRSIVAGVLAAGLLFTFSPPTRACAPGSCGPKLTTVVYSVADLVIPLNQPATGKVVTQEDKLLHLLQSTTCPKTWAAMGGPGTIEFFPLTLAFVITQTPDVHEQVTDLLAALRRLQDVQVAAEVRFVTVSPDLIERLGLLHKETTNPGMTLLDDAQLQVFLEAVQGDRRGNVLAMPKVSTYNGQRAALDLSEKQTFVVGVDFAEADGKTVPKPVTKSVKTGMQVSMLPTVAADHRSVTIHLGVHVSRADAEMDIVKEAGWTKKSLRKSESPTEPRYSVLEVEKTLKIPDGTTAMLTGWTQQREVRNQVGPPILSKIPYVSRIFSTVGYGRELEHTFVLVTPRIVVHKEEEQKATKPQVDACEELPRISESDLCPPQVLSRVAHQEKPPAPAEKAKPADLLFVNKHSFELNYQLDNVGPSQVKAIEVWWTHGDGKWSRYPDEVKPKGPVPIAVQHDGRYGFTLVPVSGAGLAGKRPLPGEEPMVWVEVDQKSPTVELYSVDTTLIRDGKEAIVLTWKAEDKNLRGDAISLYWSETPAGPWQEIAKQVANSGKHVCSVKGLPYQFYLQATASDLAGNVGTATTAEPVKIDLRIPVIRDVKVNVRK